MIGDVHVRNDPMPSIRCSFYSTRPMGIDGCHIVSPCDCNTAAYELSFFMSDGSDGWWVKEKAFSPEVMQESVIG